MKSKNTLFQSSTILFLLNILASALNYICQLIFARVLTVEAYGTVNTIFSFMLIIAVPGTTLTMIVSRKLAGEFEGDEKKQGSYLKKQIILVIVLTLGVLIGLVVLRPVLSNILQISDVFVLLLAFFLSSLGFFQPLYSGVFSGTKRFIWVGLYSLLIPISKIVAILGATVYSTKDEQRLYMVLIIMLIGTVIIALIGHIKTVNIVGSLKNAGNFNGALFTIKDVETLILNLCLMFYMNIDLFSVRFYGNECDSGYYSSVLLFGRILYYFSTTLGTILLPSVAGNNVSNEQRRRKLKSALLLMIIFSVICMIPINLMKETIIEVLYGSKYIKAAKYMGYVCAISFSLSVYTIMVNYVVGIGKTKMATRIILIMVLSIAIEIVICSNLNIILFWIAIVGSIGTLMTYFYHER